VTVSNSHPAKDLGAAVQRLGVAVERLIRVSSGALTSNTAETLVGELAKARQVGEMVITSAGHLFAEQPEAGNVVMDSEPFAGYEGLSASEILECLPHLTPSQLELVRTYEGAHRRRPRLLAALDS
jgi:hypothetical protein